MAAPFQSVSDRIEAKVIRLPFSGCWIYDGSVNNKGYAYMHVNGRPSLAHRASYQHFVGPTPPGLFVCHRCDVPSCCNPHHLFLGTQVDNLRDASRKGRTRRTPTILGEKVPFSRLTAEQVLEIRRLYADGTARRELAQKFGVTAPAIGCIVRRDVWKHI